MNVADYVDLSNPTTRWALYVAGFALVLVVLAAILAKLGLKKVSLPTWLGGAVVGMIVGAVAVGAYVYITKPVEIPPNPAAGEGYDGGGIGMSEGPGGGGMGGDMMSLGGMSATMPSGMGGPSGRPGGGGGIPPRARALGLLNGLDLLAGSFAFGLAPEQAQRLIEALEPIKESGINDENAEDVAENISGVLSEQQIQLLRRVRSPRAGRRGQGGGFGGGGPGMTGGPGMAGGPGGYPTDYPGLRPPQQGDSGTAESKTTEAQSQEAAAETDPSVELVNRVLDRLARIATSGATPEPKPPAGEQE